MPTADREGLADAMLRHEYPSQSLVPFVDQPADVRNHWLGKADALIAGPLAQADTAAQAVAERDEARARSMPHMCRDGHPEIRHADSGEDERCPVCRERDRAEAALTEAARLSAEVETRDKALKPFAEYARLKEEAGLDWGEGEIGEFIYDGLRRSIRTQDLRAARTALAAGQDKEGGKP